MNMKVQTAWTHLKTKPKPNRQTKQRCTADLFSQTQKANLHHSCTSEQRTQSILYYDGQPSLTKAHGFGSQ